MQACLGEYHENVGYCAAWDMHYCIDCGEELGHLSSLADCLPDVVLASRIVREHKPQALHYGTYI